MDLSTFTRKDQAQVAPLAALLISAAALIGLVFDLAPSIIPGMLLLALGLLVYPLRKNRFIARVVILAILLVAAWFFVSVMDFLAPFLVVAIVVYLVNPVVTRLEARGVPRWVSALAFLPLFMFYLLKDLPTLVAWTLDLVPDGHHRDVVAGIGKRLDALLGQYFRGALAVAGIQGAISTVGLWLIGIKHPVLLGVMTGFLDLFPYVGLFISLVVSALVAYTGGGAILTKIILITLLYLSQKLLEATVLAPKIVGPHVGLHPVLLILSLFLCDEFMGFVGLLIAVPAGAAIVAASRAWADRQKPRVIIESST